MNWAAVIVASVVVLPFAVACVVMVCRHESKYLPPPSKDALRKMTTRALP